MDKHLEYYIPMKERKGEEAPIESQGKKKPSIPHQNKDPQPLFVCRHYCRCTRAIVRMLPCRLRA